MKPIEILTAKLCTVPEIKKYIRYGGKPNWGNTDNPIQERNLRMYLNEKKYNAHLSCGGYLYAILEVDHLEVERVNICKLDNTKDLQDQEDKVIQDIIDFITNT